jgi:hypothetical protein
MAIATSPQSTNGPDSPAMVTSDSATMVTSDFPVIKTPLVVTATVTEVGRAQEGGGPGQGGY